MEEAPSAYDLDIRLQGCFDIFEQAREEYWNARLASDDWSQENQLRQDADSLAGLIVKRVEELQNLADAADLNELYRLTQIQEIELKQRLDTFEADLAGRLDQEILLKVLKYFKAELRSLYEPSTTGETPHDLIWQRVWVDQARSQLSQVQDRIERTYKLDQVVSRLSRHSEIPSATKQFLKLVSRSYVAGFDAECTIVCRSVIDTLFRAKVTSDMLDRRQAADLNRDPGLYAMIEAACPDLISPEILKTAHAVRSRGDKAVHYDPQVGATSLDTIEKTLQILEYLK